MNNSGLKGAGRLEPWGLVCPGACNWADWNRGATTGQAKCLSPSAGGICVVCIVYMYIYFPLTNFHPDQREEQDKVVGAIYVHVSAMSTFCLC